MSKSKYGNYVISELKLASKHSPPRQGPNPHDIPSPGEGGRIQLLYLDNEIVKNALYSECVWIMPGGELPKNTGGAHTHDFDEVITFIGNNVEDPYDLGGEIEFWLEDEPQIITRSSIIFPVARRRYCGADASRPAPHHHYVAFAPDFYFS